MRLVLGAAALLLAGCSVQEEGDAEARYVSAPSPRYAYSDTTGAGARARASVRQRAEGDTGFVALPITPGAVNAGITAYPAPLADAGPEILAVQILLDRARFSPGALDGVWGGNTSKALTWFQRAHALPATGTVDRATHEALRRAAGDAPLVVPYTVTAADVDGPFVDIPDDVYEQAELPCLCYRSPRELLAERFHSDPAVLDTLNPGVDLRGVRAGTTIHVPNVAQFHIDAVRADSIPPVDSRIARIVVNRDEFWMQAQDATGRILHYFPTVVGSGYSPSPSGEFRVERVAWDPEFHYQPELFHEVPDWKDEAMLPPGPNSPVGIVWMALSKPHYGIHGTSSPETVGHTSSHGCVRLTNWDAWTLGRRVRPGTPVRFTR